MRETERVKERESVKASERVYVYAERLTVPRCEGEKNIQYQIWHRATWKKKKYVSVNTGIWQRAT